MKPFIKDILQPILKK